MELLKEHETNNRSKGCKVLPKQLFFPTYASEHDEDSVHTYSYNYKYEEKHVMMQLVTVVSYLALWFFMKFGPCLRNSVVSPKTGQPIVPGGKPFFLYLTSFHLKRAEQKQSTSTTPTIAMNTAIDAPTLNPKETSKRRYNLFCCSHPKSAHKHTYL